MPKPYRVVIADDEMISRGYMELFIKPSIRYEIAAALPFAQDVLAWCGENPPPDLIILDVKPIYVRDVIDEIRPALNGKAVLSIAAGWTVSMLENALYGTSATYLRVMPNTPALVGEGMTAICDNTTFSKEDFNYAKGIFDSVGKTKVLPERLFDGVVAVSGSSPAYVYMMIEAMADAAVKEGIPRVYAYEMAAQSVLGSALMVLSSGTHPAALKDAVCSPGGTTIEAVEVLERKGFRAAIMDAMGACAARNRERSKESE